MDIDIKTLFYLFTAANVFIVLFFAAYILLHKAKMPIINIFIVTKVLGVSFLALFSLRNSIPDLYSIILANIILVFTNFYEVYCIAFAEKKFNRKQFLRLNLIPVLFALLFLAFVSTPENTRVIIVSIIISLIYMSTGILLFIVKTKTKIQRIGAVLFLGVSFLFLLRAYWAFFVDSTSEIYTKNNIQVLAYVFSFLVSFVSPILLLLILKENDEEKIEKDNLKLKELQKELIIAKENLEEAQQIAHVGHWELDILNNKLTWSDEIFRIFNLKPQEFEATYEAFLEKVHPEDRDNVNETYINSLKTKKPYEIEHRLLLSLGEIKYVLEKCFTEYNDRGEPVRSIGAVLDITNLKLVEQKLRELNATKDMLFSIIGHDLRGPIGSFKNLTEMIVSEFDLTDTAKLSKTLKVISKSANSIYDLLENLLLWAKSQQNKIIFSPVNCNLNEITENSIHLLQELANKKKINIINNVPQNLTVFADVNMLTTIIRNLISNAIKFTYSDKSIYVSANKNKNFWLISIKDEGVGISPENLEKIFNRSENYTALGTENEKGSGLGLVLCKEFVKKHGGKIWVESEPGKYSDFKFTLPFV